MENAEAGSSIEQQRVAEVLRHYPELRDSLGRAGISSGVWFEAPHRQVLLEPGQRAPNFPLVVEGQVRVWYPTFDGTELFLYTLRAGDLCAMTALAMLSGEPSRVRAIAETQVSGVCLQGDAFRCLLQNFESFQRRVFVSLARNVSALLTMVEEVTRLDVSTRLSRRLLVDAPVLATTHQELADRLGCSRERVSRLLEGFQTSGWVQLSRGVIRVVDSGALRRAAARHSRSRPGPA
jgi:CRP-like cAMP-binding protein